MTENKKIILTGLSKAAFFLLIIYFPLFLHLDKLPIRLWDESRYSVNAIEMNQSGHFLIPTFQGEPDMWNTKPPMLIWFQVLCMKVIGMGELSVRLPSALAAALTACMIMWFFLRYLKDYWAGLIGGLILVTTFGYVDIHGTRSGDTDALLTLFTTAYSLAFWMFLENSKSKYLHLFFAALTLAILTKGIQGVLLLPGLFILLLVYRKFRTLFNKWFFIDLVSVVIIVGAYYIIRESQNPGYLEAVRVNELGGRYLETTENHGEGLGFYFDILIREQVKPWVWIIPLSIVLGFLYKDKKFKKITFSTSLIILTYLVIISISKTKVVWYLLPVYPFLAILAAVPVYQMVLILRDTKTFDKYIRFNIIPHIFLFLFFLKPYNLMVEKNYWPEEKPHEIEFYSIGYFLQDAVRSNKSLDQTYLCIDGVTKHIDFYLMILKDRGQAIDLKDWQDLEPGDHVLAHQFLICEYIDQHYESGKVYHHRDVIEYSIIGRNKNLSE